jgi:hypothetical protein
VRSDECIFGGKTLGPGESRDEIDQPRQHDEGGRRRDGHDGKAGAQFFRQLDVTLPMPGKSAT